MYSMTKTGDVIFKNGYQMEYVLENLNVNTHFYHRMTVVAAELCILKTAMVKCL